ncbi:hypothetical protein MKW98_015905, partial [Papaver atlanticum]
IWGFSDISTIKVGNVAMDSDTYGDHCWERPEDIDYIRQPIVSDSAPETAAEMAAALAASSMIFADDRDYAKKLVEEAVSLLYFAVDSGRCPSPMTEDQLYKSSGFNDEYLWASTLLYFATGNSTFLSLATDKEIATSAGAFRRSSKLRVFSWDNRLPGAALLLRRLRVFLNPGYPTEEMLSTYYGISGDNACSYLLQYGVFNYTSNYSCIVGYGTKFPVHVHHRDASIPSDGRKYNCSGGQIWLTSRHPNPHNLTGAMVGGPDTEDRFRDIRSLPDYTEPTLVDNAALAAALVSLTTSGGAGVVVDPMFYNLPSLYPAAPPPPAPWEPHV